MMKKQTTSHPSLEVIRKRLIPDFEAGTVHWAEASPDQFNTARGCNIFNSRFIGKEALTLPHRGLCQGAITVNGVKYGLGRARVLWALYHGKWPDHEIGHRNGIRSDDRITNLREQTRSDSMITRKTISQTGVVGVYPLSNGGYYACVKNRHKYLYVGTFENLDEARLAREAAALKMQGEFARIADPAENFPGGSS